MRTRIPPSEDLQLSDSLRHDFSTILEFRGILLDYFVVNGDFVVFGNG